MAVTRWNFTDGADGEVLTPALAGADTSLTTGGVMTLSDDYPLIAGAKGVRVQGTQSGHVWWAKEGLSATSYAIDVYLYIPTGTAGPNGGYVIWAGASSSAASLRLDVFTDRTIRFRTGDVAIAWTSPNAIPYDTHVRISVFVTCSPTTGTVRVQWFENGSSVPVDDSGTLTGLNTQASIDRIRVGAKAATASIINEFWINSWAYDPVATDLIPPPDDEEVPVTPPPPTIPGIASIKSGSSNVARVYAGSQVIWPPLAAEVTMIATGTVFEPLVELKAGALGTVEWRSQGSVDTGTALAPVLTWGDAGPHAVKLFLSDKRDLETLNLGFDHQQDEGAYSLGVEYDHAGQPVIEVFGLAGLPNLKNFMAANTPLAGALNFTNCAMLENVECFGASVASVQLAGCTNLIRLCFEDNALSYIDLDPCRDNLRDLRAATQQGGVLEFAPLSGPLTLLYHFCTQTQTLINAPDLSAMPAVEQWWVWNCGMTSTGTPISPNLNSPQAHGNAFTQADVDALLVHINNNVADAFGNVRLDGGTTAPPSATGIAARDALIARGNWSVTTN